MNRRTATFTLATASLFLLSACEAPVEDERGPKPNISFEWSDDANLEQVVLEGGFSQESCGISVQSPNEGQYFLDFRNFDEDAMIRLRFPETVDEPPAPGAYTVSVDVSVDFSLPSPYGVMDGTAGDVQVEEGDGWRKVTVSADVSNGVEGGYVSAILVCPM